MSFFYYITKTCPFTVGVLTLYICCICVFVGIKPWMYKCADRAAGKQMSLRCNSQSHIASCRTKLSNYRSKLCQKTPFSSFQPMGSLGCILWQHPHSSISSLPHIRTRGRAHTPATQAHADASHHGSLLMVHLPPCSPGQLNSYQRSWALFFPKANPTPVPGLYSRNRELCRVWVWMHWLSVNMGDWKTECVFERRGPFVSLRDQEQKEIVCTWIFCARIWEQTYRD